jgi:hypothetical protein
MVTGSPRSSGPSWGTCRPWPTSSVS